MITCTSPEALFIIICSISCQPRCLGKPSNHHRYHCDIGREIWLTTIIFTWFGTSLFFFCFWCFMCDNASFLRGMFSSNQKSLHIKRLYPMWSNNPKERKHSASLKTVELTYCMLNLRLQQKPSKRWKLKDATSRAQQNLK